VPASVGDAAFFQLANARPSPALGTVARIAQVPADPQSLADPSKPVGEALSCSGGPDHPSVHKAAATEPAHDWDLRESDSAAQAPWALIAVRWMNLMQKSEEQVPAIVAGKEGLVATECEGH
jgi:hypothetical protein